MKTILVTAALLALSAPAFAQSKPVLPNGSWGSLTNAPNSVPHCKPKPSLIIKDNLIIINLDDSQGRTGQGRCTVKSLKNKPHYIDGKFKCEWDKHLQPGEYESPDGNDDEFSVVVKGPDKIMYNNVLKGRCSS